MDEMKTEGLSFPVPRLKSGQSSPVSVGSVSLYKAGDTQAMMRIDILRDLSVRIESFTFKYRFSGLPFDEPDGRHGWHSFVYTDEDMNSKATLVFRGNVPSKMKLEGCTAYVSEVKLADGEVLTYQLSDFTDKPEPVGVTTPEPAAQAKPQPVKKRPVNSRRLAVVLTVIFFSLIIEIIGGVYIFNYTDAKKAANTLMDQNRFNEAYKLTLDKGYDGLRQLVCVRASEYYFESKDIEQSYVYASGAPTPFTDKIIDYAAQSVVDPATGEINENAYRVAKMAADDGKFSDIVHSMIKILENKEDFANALRVASELRSDNDRERSEQTIFTDAVRHFLSEHRFESLIAFIGELNGVNSFSVSENEIADAIIAYAKQSQDSSSLIYFSTRYPDLIDLGSIDVAIKPDDSGIHAALDVIWPLLTADQKRAYHNRTVAVYKELFVISGGEIAGTDISDAVSVATNEFHTLILRKDGTVCLLPGSRYDLGEKLPETDDIIQIAAGLKHSVMLHADGTVSATGDNSYGQCDVDGWTDIAAVAAGQNFTLGLKVDGTVVACGSNECGQCEVSGYRNVAAVAAGAQTSVLLFSDGTVRLEGYCSYGLREAEKLTGVVSLRAAGTTVVAKLKDGKFRLISGAASGNPGNPSNWSDITGYDVGSACIAAVDKSGNIYTSGDCVPRTNLVQE